MEKGLRSDDIPDFEEVQNYVEDTGEVNWLVQEVTNSETPVPAIAQSIMELFKSRGRQKETYRAIAVMRHCFGGHPFGEDKAIEGVRKDSRLEKI